MVNFKKNTYMFFIIYFLIGTIFMNYIFFNYYYFINSFKKKMFISLFTNNCFFLNNYKIEKI